MMSLKGAERGGGGYRQEQKGWQILCDRAWGDVKRVFFPACYGRPGSLMRPTRRF